MRVVTPFLAALALGMASAGPAGAGAWNTWIRVSEFTGLAALEDEVWGATAEAGLLRWDRSAGRFDVFRREPGSIPSNRLTALVVDRSAQVWVGTVENGASRRTADGRRWVVVNVLDGLPSDSITVLEAAGDTVWIGTTRGLALWNGREVSGSLPDGVTASFDTTFRNVSVTGIAQHDGRLWLSTRRGIGFASLATALADWRPANQGLPVLDVQELASDGIALFARVGAAAYRWESGAWTPAPGAGAVRELAGSRGTVFAAGDSSVFRWTRSPGDSGWTLVPDSPRSPPGAARDPEVVLAPDGILFAARRDTLFEQPPAGGPWAIHPAPAGPPANDLLHVGAQGSRIYVTTQTRGVARLEAGVWRYWPPVPCAGTGCDTTFWHARQAVGFLVDSQGRKWVGNWSSALSSFDDSPSPPEFEHHVIAIDLPSQKRTWMLTGTSDRSGGRWLAMDTPLKGEVEGDPIGIEHYDSLGSYAGNFNPSNSHLKGSYVRGLAVTGNRLWIGMDEGAGIDYVDLPAESAKFVHVISAGSLAVRGVAAYGDSVWFLTAAELWRFPSSATAASQPAEKIRVRGGQAKLGVHPLTVGLDGRVWAGTTEGLFSFGPGGARDSFDTASSPLPDDEVRGVAVDDRGVVWIATAAGLASYDPSWTPPPAPVLPALHVRIYPNPARLTALGAPLRIGGEAESYTGEVYDLSGRRVARFQAPLGGVVWNGRDREGRAVKPGVYFVRVEAGGRVAVARLVLLR